MKHLFDALENILGSVGLEQEEGYTSAKLMSEAILNILRPPLQDLADVHVGNPPPDIEVNSPTIQHSFSVRLPQLFTPFMESGPRTELKKMFMELLELGVVFHMMHAGAPSRHADAKLIDLNRLRLEWLSRVDNAFILMRGLEKIYYGGIGRIFIKRVTEEKILPFYKSYGISTGFLGWNKRRLSAYAQILFYAGTYLAVMYDALTTGDADLISHGLSDPQ